MKTLLLAGALLAADTREVPGAIQAEPTMVLERPEPKNAPSLPGERLGRETLEQCHDAVIAAIARDFGEMTMYLGVGGDPMEPFGSGHSTDTGDRVYEGRLQACLGELTRQSYILNGTSYTDAQNPKNWLAIGVAYEPRAPRTDHIPGLGAMTYTTGTNIPAYELAASLNVQAAWYGEDEATKRLVTKQCEKSHLLPAKERECIESQTDRVQEERARAVLDQYKLSGGSTGAECFDQIQRYFSTTAEYRPDRLDANPPPMWICSGRKSIEINPAETKIKFSECLPKVYQDTYFHGHSEIPGCDCGCDYHGR